MRTLLRPSVARPQSVKAPPLAAHPPQSAGPPPTCRPTKTARQKGDASRACGTVRPDVGFKGNRTNYAPWAGATLIRLSYGSWPSHSLPVSAQHRQD
ncbi:hypothetical protein GGP41_010543 [Bipolaris sorokiniana]|uniref:Uncharacterized protein n=1 Tax=Cochliobolus sativus TaxID=45130 RepID=A0A8H5ZKA9_COCSA|nr:hypothetical protein GGP41_010543 [Bipolaris sorokiniana]